jgi:L-fucose isomerase-like protein
MFTKHLTPNVGVASVSSPLEVGANCSPQAALDLARVLENAGCRVCQLGSIGSPEQAVVAGRKAVEGHVDVMAFAPASWFEDYLVLDFLEECQVPILFWPLPGMETGALCGTQQITCYLKQLEHSYYSVFGEIEDATCLKQAQHFLRAAALKTCLRRAHIGMAGHRIAGMTHTAPNEFMLKKAIGPRVVPLDLPLLLEKVKQIPDDDAIERWKGVVERAGSCQVKDEEGTYSMKVYTVVKGLIAEYGLDALTIGCYPHLMGKVCLPASLLADEGIPFGCEGDINGVVGQLMLMLLTNTPTHHTDWLDPLEDDTVIFTHCGSGSFSLAEKQSDITLASVRLMGQGVCALFPARPGPVTLLSLIAQPGGYQCALLEGEALSTEMVFPGNPVRVRFAVPTSDIIQWIFDEGIGHHWMIGYGHVGEEIRAWAKVVGKEVYLIEP